MNHPQHVRLDAKDPSLLGVRQVRVAIFVCRTLLISGWFFCGVQYRVTVASGPLPHEVFLAKTSALLDVLARLSFRQCVVFTSLKNKAESLCAQLVEHGWPAGFLSSLSAQLLLWKWLISYVVFWVRKGDLDQTARLETMAGVRNFQLRVLVSTDVVWRGDVDCLVFL
jgi:superfamily II DNA/RNA helicase